MKKDGWKGPQALKDGTLDDEEAERLKEQALTNRKQRRASGQGEQKMGGGLKELVDKFSDSVKAAREQQVSADEGDGIDMPMPNRQEVGESVIAWYWEGWVEFDVVARYIKNKDNVWAKPVGTYFVDIGLNSKWSSELSAEQTAILAGVLASAYKWERLWRQHAGEYLALDGALEPVESDAAQG